MNLWKRLPTVREWAVPGVKAVIDRTVVVLVRHMQHGRRVQVGDLGHFRYNFGSEGVPDERVLQRT